MYVYKYLYLFYYISKQNQIVDPDTGKNLPAGERGELWARGPQIMKGYLNNPDATAACIDSDGYFHTGMITEML